MRLRIQLNFVLEVAAGEDLYMAQDFNDCFEAAARALYPKLEVADIELEGKLGVTMLRQKK